MKCNACWKNLEGRAVATTCGHIFCTEDAQKILSSVDANCPLCEQTLSKSKVKAVDMSPTDEWINMVMAGVAPQSNFRQKCEQMQGAYAQKMRQVEEAYTAKLQQVHSGYQKAMKKIQAMDHEKEVMLKDKKEIQEKYTEKSRQKRKLEEMYDALRKEYELLRRSIASSTPDNTAVVQRPNPYSFAPNFNGLDDLRHQTSGLSDMAPNTPAVTPNFWRNSCPEAQLCSFDLPSLPQSSRNQRQATGNSLPRPFSAGSPTMFNASLHSQFATSAGAQPSDTFRNLLRSPSTRRSQGLTRGL